MKSLVKFPIQQDNNGSNWLKINRKPTLMSVLCRDKLISHWPTLSALSNIWGMRWEPTLTKDLAKSATHGSAV
jgi:hypothetical protein